MIACGVNAKALSSFMGQASITVTFGLYGHLMPGLQRQTMDLVGDALEPAMQSPQAS